MGYIIHYVGSDQFIYLARNLYLSFQKLAGWEEKNGEEWKKDGREKLMFDLGGGRWIEL